jgi:putative transcriptional regulator
MITHHPDAEILVDYAAGALTEGLALAIATHAWYCAECRQTIGRLEEMGGVLLDACPPVELTEGALDAMLARLDEPEPPRAPAPAPSLNDTASIPAPLARYIGGSIADAAWRRVGRMFDEARLPLSTPSVKASLMRFRPQSLVPHHTHRGLEYTVVLAGGYSDAGRSFGPGDFAAQDSSHHHQPRIDDDGDCVCLVVLDAPLKFTSIVGRLVNPFLRI